MSIPSKQIGQSAEANLLWNISKQLDNLRKTSSIVDPALLAKIDELITVSSEIEISAENINLNTDDLETLISEGNALLEQIRDNTAAFLISNVSFYTALQDYGTYAKNDVLSRTDFYNQANGDLVFTKWYNATRESIVEVVGDETNLLLQGTEKDQAFNFTLLGNEESDVIDVSNISSIGFITSVSKVSVRASINGVTYHSIPILNSSGSTYSDKATDGVNSSSDVSSINYIKFVNEDPVTTEVNGLLSMINVKPNGAPTLQKQNELIQNLGAIGDTSWSGTGDGSLIAIGKGIYGKLNTDANGNLKINQTATTFTYSPNNSTNGNSSVFALANSATWNGTIENAINQPYLIFGVMSDRNVTVTLSQFLNASGTIQDVPAKTFTVTAGVPFSTSVAILGNYVRLSVNNASGASANLYVDSYYGLLPVQADSLTQFGNFKSAISEVGGVVVPATGILVTGRTGQPTATPTVTSASAYTAGNLVGGLMTFTNCFASGLTSGVLQSVVIKSKSVQTTTFKLYIFSQQPTNTVWTDKTAPNINALDLPFLIDIFLFAAPDSGLGTMTIYTQDGLGKSIANTANGQNLWGLLVTTGTPTFSSTSDVSVTLGILQD
jgi:hypothetical protein